MSNEPGRAPVEDTFPKLLRRQAAERGDRPAFRLKDRGIWRTWSWREVERNVRALAQSFKDLGLVEGDKLAIVGANRPILYWSVLAAQILRATPVPVYADSVVEEMAYVLENADVKIAVVQDQEQVDKLLAMRDRLQRLTFVLYDEPRGLRDYDHAQLRALEILMAEGRAKLDADPALERAMDAAVEAGQADDPSVILYTSGTTGRSKGVVLAAGRSTAAARDTVAFDKLSDRDEQLAYLPLAWVGDHYLNFAQALVAGICVACPESADTVQEDLREIGPSFYFAPPRVFEAMLTRVTIRMQDASRVKRALFDHFLAHAKKWGERILNRQSVPILARLHYALGEALIYGPLKNVLGFSNIRVAYTAGEAIGAELFAFYRSIGLNLKQLYGQTEAFLYVTAHPDGAIRVETVGTPAPNVQIRIAEDGEVQFKSPGQFVGYYKDAEKTAETLTDDGYVRTGDAGFFDPDGQLRILDRAKDVGRLNDGSLFAPKYIENKLKFFPEVKEAVAYGHERDFVTAMLNIDLTAVGAWAERNNISYGSYQELAAHPKVYELIGRHVAQVNRVLAGEPRMNGSQIRRFLILHKELDADDGELTRTQKVRRAFIADRYRPLTEGLYDGARMVEINTEVAFEDGRKGMISGRVVIVDAALARLEEKAGGRAA